MNFEPFAKIHRLFRRCIITEKIDGTNAQVHVLEDGTVLAGSRNRYLTTDKDNFGFARWVSEHEDELRRLGPGRHFGEWWGAGIQRRYGLSEKRFSLFNTSRWGGDDLPDCCSVVPVLHDGDFGTGIALSVLDKLKREGSVASPGFMNPEGIVVFLCQPGILFKATLDGDGHKGAKS